MYVRNGTGFECTVNKISACQRTRRRPRPRRGPTRRKRTYKVRTHAIMMTMIPRRSPLSQISRSRDLAIHRAEISVQRQKRLPPRARGHVYRAATCLYLSPGREERERAREKRKNGGRRTRRLTRDARSSTSRALTISTLASTVKAPWLRSHGRGPGGAVSMRPVGYSIIKAGRPTFTTDWPRCACISTRGNTYVSLTPTVTLYLSAGVTLRAASRAAR